MAPPISLSSYVIRKLRESLRAKPDCDNKNVDVAAKSLADALAAKYPTDLKAFSEEGQRLCKAIGVVNFKYGCIDTDWNAGISDLLSRYGQYLLCNESIFDNITNHHTNIIKENWSDVAKDNAALAVYSSAASSMGAKKWVVECNQWMESFALNYFRSGGSRKHYIKQYRARNKKERTKADYDQENLEFCKLENDLLADSSTSGGFKKLRLLDVGSCYNPIAKSTEGDKFDVTALDLYPADATVFQCDFLNIEVGSEGSQPIILPPVPVECDDENPTKKQKTILSTSTKTATDETPMPTSQRLQRLPAASFDAVTMSLVLNYLPTSDQRLTMIRRARALLTSPPLPACDNDDNNDSNGASVNTPGSATATAAAASAGPPHRNGILLLAEKQSIFKSPTSGATKRPTRADSALNAAEEDLWTNWVNAICSCGFELIKYQFLLTSDGRKSHLFAFATVNMDQNCAPSSLKLSIKQDFEKRSEC